MELQIDTHFVGYDTRMNLILEWSPLIVFFVGFKLLGIYWATAALMIAFVLQLVVHRLRTGKFKTMHVITTVVAVGLGSATLLLHDSRFIQWKPTVLLALAAAAFLGSMFIGKQPFARRMLESAFNEPLDVSPRAWWVINSLWTAWLALLAIANIYVARNFDEKIWVNFKVFGITAAMMVFMVPQVFWLSGKIKAAQSDPNPNPDSEPG
jgi:intracellular septation protein